MRIVQYTALGILVSLFYFSFSFTFLPESVNTKLILAALGVAIAGYHAVQQRAVKIPGMLLGAVVFAVLFSSICFIAVDYNHTHDFSYATYVVSFSIWLFAAYTVCAAIRMVHQRVDFELLTYYLAVVCVVQCVLALWIDSSPEFQRLVNSYVEQDQLFLMKVERLYGIGASLDNAGVRFSVVLIMIAVLLSKNGTVLNSKKRMTLLLMSFFIIFVVGSIIARTTSLGGVLGLLYIVFHTKILTLVIQKSYLRFHFVFAGIITVVSLLTVYLYQTNPVFHDYIRFAFEGFFNWIEKGEWRTDSTDKLNANMWIWPEDTKTWIIGSGLFDGWVYGTDIGYCRFILYCGLTGFSVFALFFIYNAVVLGLRYKEHWSLFLFLLVLTFIIWLKVSTDIFLIYALFYGVEALGCNMFLEEEKI